AHSRQRYGRRRHAEDGGRGDRRSGNEQRYLTSPSTSRSLEKRRPELKTENLKVKSRNAGLVLSFQFNFSVQAAFFSSCRSIGSAQSFRCVGSPRSRVSWPLRWLFPFSRRGWGRPFGVDKSSS